MAWLQCSDTEKGPSRWQQLHNGAHILPGRGLLHDANAFIDRWGLYGSNGMGMTPVTASDMRSNLEVTGGTITPYEADAALLASSAYVAEHYRSMGKSTDAPWDWPKTETDHKVIADQQDKAMRLMMGD